MHSFWTSSDFKKLSSLLTIVLLASFSSYCSSGGGKKRGSNPPYIPTTPTPTPEPTDEPDVDVDPDDVVDVETGGSSLTTTLNFETTGGTIGGSSFTRQASEYLLIVRAASKSCIRIKVASDSLEGQDDAADQDDVATDTPSDCTETADESEESAGTEEDESEDPSLNLWTYGEKSLGAPNFSLVGDTLCSTRLFRMKTNDIIRSKTARLAYRHTGFTVGGQTRFVRVWVDEELGTITCNGTGMNDRDRIAYAPLWGSGFNGYFDRFLQAHVQSLAEHTAQSYMKLAATYGDISDVDDNNGVDIFISPEINRQHFVNFIYNEPNGFEVEPIYKPQDLAAFDSVKNPTSNEGEIIYMWAPDPSGAYKNFTYPSSVSLTSDYARGAVGFQIMNHMFINQRAIENKFAIEEDWLRESISFLASSYVGGNNFTFRYVSNYLSSQPQILSLNLGAEESDYSHFSGMEARGFRAMFGWYLHARLCGTAITPCAALTNVIESNTSGKTTVEAVTDKTFNEVLENYGVSVGVALADDPDAAKAFWNSAPSGYPEAPFDMPKAGFINLGPSAGNLPTNIVNLPNAANVSSSTPGLILPSSSISGPFTSRDMEIFQPIFPDYEVDLNLTENSVTFILLTGLIDQETAARAIFGKNLKVVIVPLGEINSGPIKPVGNRRNRILHSEKVDENNTFNSSPINLTTADVDWLDPAEAFTNLNIADPDMQLDFRHPRRMNFNPMAYPDVADTEDLVVSGDKDLWISGSIENGDVTIGGTEGVLGDTDSYVFEANPCLGLSGGALTTCQGMSHNLVLQLSSRIFTAKIEPMFLVTANDTDLLRGKQIVRTLEDVGGDLTEVFVPLEDEVQVVCESSDQYPLLVPPTCANGGTLSESNGPQFFFDNYNYRHPNDEARYAQIFDNYLYGGPLGYPFTNAWTIARDELDGPAERAHRLDFSSEEFNRSFYTFRYDATLIPKTFKFFFYNYAVSDPLDFGLDEFEALPDDTVTELNLIKDYLDDLMSEPAPAAEDFVTACGNYLEDATICETPYANRAVIVALMLTYLHGSEKEKVVICNNPGAVVPCSNLGILNQTSGSANLASWNIANAAFDELASTYKSYYKPVYTTGGQASNCRGNAQFDPSSFQTFCTYSANADFVQSGTDIRTQFPVRSSEIFVCGHGALCDISSPSFKLGLDYLSYRESIIDPGKIYSWHRQLVTGEVFPTIGDDYNDSRIGEVIGKTGLLHSQEITVPGTGATIHVIIGGKDNSEGKYLFRARFKNFDVALDPSELY